jgi:hypothetical protein
MIGNVDASLVGGGVVIQNSHNMSTITPTIEAELEILQCESFSYFLHETNPANGLVIDKTAPDWPASIAAIGFALGPVNTT